VLTVDAGQIPLGKYMVARLRPPLSPNLKTSRWDIFTKSGDHLGHIHWYTGWRQYVFLPTPGSAFSVGCMTDIQDFIAATNKQEGRT
jgi:hypothetical protein